MCHKKIIVAVILLVLFLFVTQAFSNEIHQAAMKGDLAGVKKILAKKPDSVNSKDEDGKTPLHFAVQSGNKEVAEFLFAQGADINAKDAKGNTPLHSALAHKRADIARFLLSKGADVKIKAADGTPVIVIALMRGLKELVVPILDYGQDVNEKFEGGLRIIHMASLLGDKEIVEILLDRGADINVKSDENITPLYAAIFLGNTGMADLLLSRGAAKDYVETQTGRTYLHLAVIKGYGDMMELFRAKGLDVNARDNSGKTPLQYAAKYGHKKIADLLIKHGARAKDLEENYGMSPFLKKKLNSGDAVVWYLGTSGWAVKTKNKLLIFDYHIFGRKPDEPFLSNGHIIPEEMLGQKIYVFVTHGHNDHFNPVIFEWKKSVGDIVYILGFKPKKAPEYIYMNPREKKMIDGMVISTIESNDAGVGFLVNVDGLVLFHAGDHACKQQDMKGPYSGEIDFLAENGNKPDIAFLPITGCGFRDPAAVRKGVYYTLEKLQPKVMFPMHAAGFEYLYKDFVKEASKDKFKAKTKFICSGNKGDRFIYSKGKIK
ncbi:MAG: ankyrin repeat domain-containing protein [Candidatus Aminicenantes bacterium]|nr:MAG: ankyrin repeat domain-containing protein [Candidatus Aminicenantes bacterium]